MAGRSPARFLAPLALVGFAIALVMVISASSDSDGDDAGVAPLQTPARTTGAGEGGRARGRRQRRQTRATYTVKPGDTPSAISDAHDITVQRLLELNPDIDPNALTVGERLRVR